MCVLNEALRLEAAGFSVLPLRADGSKCPWFKWGKYQTERPSAGQLRAWITGPLVGLAVVGGNVSRNFACLDFDDHCGKVEAQVFDKWCSMVSPALLKRLVIYSTPGNGWRVAYRCPIPPPKPSIVWARLSEKEVIVEELSTKIILVPGGHADAHRLRRPYVYTQGHLAEVPTITDLEHYSLLSAAWACTAWKRPRKEKPKPAEPKQRGSSLIATPWDDFDKNGTWEECLPGWDDLGGGKWRRPDKHDGISATADFHDGWFHVFTSNAAPLEQGKAYRKSQLFALLCCDGDFSEAARQLGDKGFGGVRLSEEQKKYLERFSQKPRNERGL